MVGAVLREQNALPYEGRGTKYLTAKAAIDNCRAGRAAKGASPSGYTKKPPPYRVPTRDFFGKAVLFKSQAWRNATPFLVLFNFLHLINHQNRVNLLLQLNCR